jgi:hypothetical protein
MLKTLFTLILALPLATQAGTVFSDGFESPDATGLNVVPSGWTITNGGTVDIIGFGCHSGIQCVDLDGSSGLAGVLTHTFNATLGVNYNLSFWLTGSQRGDVNTVDILLGSAPLTVSSIASNASATEYNLNWTATATGVASFSFHNLGGDNVGAILDDVVLSTSDSTVPEPATFVLLGAGLAVMVALRRRMTALRA